MTFKGIVTWYCLFSIKIGTREVNVAGVTPHPRVEWMKQIARNLIMAGPGWGRSVGSIGTHPKFSVGDRPGTTCFGSYRDELWDSRNPQLR